MYTLHHMTICTRFYHIIIHSLLPEDSIQAPAGEAKGHARNPCQEALFHLM